MKVLMVSRYVQANAKGANSTVYPQALSLKTDHAVNVEIFTWPYNDLWTGPVPENMANGLMPPMSVETSGLVYHLINPPSEWNERPLRAHTWEEAVAYGIRTLAVLRPDVVHLQHWFGLWWMLESAQQLRIPTVYTSHDWGMACLRTVLVKGDDSLCDGQLSVDKCAQCIWLGRNFIGKVNELVAETKVGRGLIEAVYCSPLKTAFERSGAVRLPVSKRVALNLARAKQVLGKLDAMFTPSEFGCTFYSQLGVPAGRIRVRPWYCDPIHTQKTINPSQPFTMTYIGRVSPEKGVHLIFEALSRVDLNEPIQLRIAGANNSDYCLRLKQKHLTHVGAHKVEWLGWSEIESLFLSTDVSIIPSTWIDNTPFSLVEALSYKVPVIATKVPTIAELVTDGQNGYLAEYNSIDSLAVAIQRAVADKDYIRSGSMAFPRVSTCKEYTQELKNAYLSIMNPESTT